MTGENIVRIVSYTTASMVLLVGFVVLLNIFTPAPVSDNFRVILGIAMVLYGVYRVTMLWRKQRNANTDVEE